jgi:cell division protein FtsI (penicillin-binding protein 3)
MAKREGFRPTTESTTGGIRKTDTRTLIVKIGFLGLFAVVALRLVQIQVIQAPQYQEQSRRQSEVKVELPAERGSIYDRNGRLLVANARCVSFGADPKMVGGGKNGIAKRFATVFDKPVSAYLEKLNQDDKHFVWLERRMPQQVADRINVGEFEGLVAMSESRRMYHYDRVAGQLLGFTDIDNNGLSGVELEFDSLLRGTNGYLTMQRDALGRRRPSMDYPRVEPVNGSSVVLTIDVVYQAIVEEELRKGVEQNRADAGLAAMMDPRTGEILAMANYPSINPADPSAAPQDALRNRVITDAFEPGSVFKIVTAAAALDNNLVQPDQKFYAEQGVYTVRLPNGKKRNVITDTHKYGILTFQEAIEFSSNIVMAKISDIVGAEGLYTMARNFGFGTETGIDLPGEISGELKKPTEWSGTTLNTMAYGYEVAVTPLQLLAAYAAVANEGVLMRPYVIRRVTDPSGRDAEEFGPQVVRRVVSRHTAETLVRFFRMVVEHGTGAMAAVKGLAVAGKTGTSRKFSNGHYVPGSYTASFVGFFPADDPAVVCLVMLDNPPAERGYYTGGLVSAPIFRAIAEKLAATSSRFVQKSGVIASDSRRAAVPDVASLAVDEAKAALAARGFDVEVRGNGGIVVRQSPGAGSRSVRGSSVVITTGPLVSPGKGYTVIPDVRGLPIRRAVTRLALQRLDAAITGSGTVTAQSPMPGERAQPGSRVTIRCTPRSASALALH